MRTICRGLTADHGVALIRFIRLRCVAEASVVCRRLVAQEGGYNPTRERESTFVNSSLLQVHKVNQASDMLQLVKRKRE